jgi:hypothetical protein
MKYNLMRYFVLIFILFSECILSGQGTTSALKKSSDCVLIIRDADQNFQNGQYDKCIEILESVLKTCKLSRNDEEHTLELLAKAYIEIQDPGKAESMVSILLKKFPHYELKEPENFEEYSRLINKFEIHPWLSIGIRNTARWLAYKPLKTYSVLAGLDYTVPYQTYGYGFMYYGWGEIEFIKDISINGDLIFMDTGYDRSIKKDPGFSLYFQERDGYLEIPVYVKKYFHIGKNVLPFVTAGAGWLYMLRANATEELIYTKDDAITGKNADFKNRVSFNMLEMRNRVTYEWLVGAGVGYKLKNLRLFVETRYYGGLGSIMNEAHRQNNNVLTNDYFYVDNSVKLNQFELGASISYTLFNSVKRIRK